MIALTYPARDTAILLVDSYNDALSEGGKVYHFAKPVADAVGTLCNMQRVVGAARSTGMRVVHVPHRRPQSDDLDSWAHPTPHQCACHRQGIYGAGTWGGEWHPDFTPQPGDIVAQEHWTASGFANTDLDVRLRRLHVGRLVLIGMLANTCVEGTGRAAVDLGYHVTLLRDATAAFSPEAMHAAHDLNGPTYAHAIVTTDDFLASLRPGAA